MLQQVTVCTRQIFFFTVFIPLKRKYIRLVNVWVFFLFMPDHCARDISIRGTVVCFNVIRMSLPFLCKPVIAMSPLSTSILSWWLGFVVAGATALLQCSTCSWECSRGGRLRLAAHGFHGNALASFIATEWLLASVFFFTGCYVFEKENYGMLEWTCFLQPIIRIPLEWRVDEEDGWSYSETDS